jgi:hypothetical protein
LPHHPPDRNRRPPLPCGPSPPCVHCRLEV